MGNYQTYYRVAHGKKVLLDYSEKPAACFGEYNYQYSSNAIKSFPENVVELHVRKEYRADTAAKMLFTEEEIKLIVSDLRECSFPYTMETQNDRYVITTKEADYINRSHVRTSLDFVRMLWEKDINKILKKYLSIDRCFVRQHTPFKVIQAVSVALKSVIMTGHTVPSSIHGIIDLESFMKLLKDNPQHSNGSQDLWRTYFSSADRTQIKAENEAFVNEVKELINPPEVKKELILV